MAAHMSDDELKKVHQAIIRNADDLVKAAKALPSTLDHVRYHLAVLALEEVGKADLIGMRSAASELGRPTEMIDNSIEDHIKKLFWAIWGPSFGREIITRQQIELTRGLATRLHEKRLHYLYVDPDDALLPEDKVDHSEVENLVSLAEARVGMAKARGPLQVDESKTEDVRWFINATDDPDKRNQIFGNKSMNKLAELGETGAWICWLREVFTRHEGEMRALTDKELARERPEGEEAMKEKWRLKVRIYSHSHSVKQKALNKWNDVVMWIKLRATGHKVYSASKKDEMVCEFTLPKAVPAQALWDHGWGISRMFVTALNIGTRGFFWWYVPQDTRRFYEEIWDIEANAGVGIEAKPSLELNWGNLVLTEHDMNIAAVVFGYLLRIRGEEREKPFNAYITGLTFFSKIDWHFRFESNAFEQFFVSLKTALEVNGHWDGNAATLKAAAVAQLTPMLKKTDNLEATIELGLQLDQAKTTGHFPAITLTEVMAIKLYCDLYFTRLANEALRAEGVDGETPLSS